MNSSLRPWLAMAVTGALAACSGEGDPIPPPGGNPPVIASFAAVPAGPVAKGASVSLSWSVSNATSVSIAEGSRVVLASSAEATGNVDSGPLDATATFTLTAKGSGGETSKTVTVTVDPTLISVLQFEAQPPKVAINGTTSLIWRTAGATRVRITRGAEEIVNTTAAAEIASGRKDGVVIDAASVSFTLFASNDTKTETKEITVRGLTPPTIERFAATPALFSGAGGQITLTWNAANADTVTITANGTPVPGVDNAATGTVTANVTETTTFILTAANELASATATQLVARGVQEVEPNDTATAAGTLTGGVFGELTAGDEDWFKITIPASGNIYAEVSDGQGGCAFDSVLTLYEPDGTEIVTENDDGGIDACSLIDPRRDPSAANLPAGDYYLRVRAYGDEVGNYVLVARVDTARCGNGIIEAEQCDDGNTTTGDGCSATCEFEVMATHNGPRAEEEFTGNLAAGQRHIYKIVLASKSYLRAEVFIPTRGQCDGAYNDTMLQLMTESGTIAIGSNDDGGIEPCSRIEPGSVSWAYLEAGTYTLIVRPYSLTNTTPIGAYTLVVSTFGPGCGNGVFDDGEFCDDGNTTAGDGCDATCHFEIAGSFSPPGGTASPTFAASGDYTSYSINLTQAGQSITATISSPTGADCGLGAMMALLDPQAVVLAVARPGQTATDCAQLVVPGDYSSTDLAVGVYTLVVQLTDTATGTVKLDVGIITPECGNGVIETRATEVCDDHNKVAADGCSATCQLEGAWTHEVEPNQENTEATASSAVKGQTVHLYGGLEVEDADVWSFDVPAGQTAALTAITYGVPGNLTSCNGDSILELFNSAGARVAQNDDRSDLQTYCGRLDPVRNIEVAALTAGRYYLRVTSYGGVRMPVYLLDVQLQ